MVLRLNCRNERGGADKGVEGELVMKGAVEEVISDSRQLLCLGLGWDPGGLCGDCACTKSRRGYTLLTFSFPLRTNSAIIIPIKMITNCKINVAVTGRK